ncbi:G protein pathway suppressor 2 [Culicoides brevitarsis]|uniref:G protein pathway suppressor 2 n=1 Tax=Culicoides brevitarsis TaxID=469753 RepID=UPI00307B1EDD
MPAAAAAAKAEKTEQQEKLWAAIKRHVLSERKRKKEELEAEVDKERLRKEREAREKENVMTLGETTEQINLLERKLEDLKKEKSKLFIQLKKVLNKDDNRKRQSEKDAPQESFPPASKASSQIPQSFIPPYQQYPQTNAGNQGSGGRGPENNHPMHKRKRSPSPPTPNYHRPVPEDHRRANERAVLWNKSMQYRPTAITTAIPYHVPQQQGKPQMYPYHGIRHGYPPAPSSSQIKHDVPPNKSQPANIYHIDVKHQDVRPDLRQSAYDSMATLRRDQIPLYQIQMGQNPGQVVKSGGNLPQVSYGPRPPSSGNPSHYPSSIHRY